MILITFSLACYPWIVSGSPSPPSSTSHSFPESSLPSEPSSSPEEKSVVVRYFNDTGKFRLIKESNRTNEYTCITIKLKSLIEYGEDDAKTAQKIPDFTSDDSSWIYSEGQDTLWQDIWVRKNTFVRTATIGHDTLVEFNLSVYLFLEDGIGHIYDDPDCPFSIHSFSLKFEIEINEWPFLDEERNTLVLELALETGEGESECLEGDTQDSHEGSSLGVSSESQSSEEVAEEVEKVVDDEDGGGRRRLLFQKRGMHGHRGRHRRGRFLRRLGAHNITESSNYSINSWSISSPLYGLANDSRIIPVQVNFDEKSENRVKLEFVFDAWPSRTRFNYDPLIQMAAMESPSPTPSYLPSSSEPEGSEESEESRESDSNDGSGAQDGGPQTESNGPLEKMGLIIIIIVVLTAFILCGSCIYMYFERNSSESSVMLLLSFCGIRSSTNLSGASPVHIATNLRPNHPNTAQARPTPTSTTTITTGSTRTTSTANTLTATPSSPTGTGIGTESAKRGERQVRPTLPRIKTTSFNTHSGESISQTPSEFKTTIFARVQSVETFTSKTGSQTTSHESVPSVFGSTTTNQNHQNLQRSSGHGHPSSDEFRLSGSISCHLSYSGGLQTTIVPHAGRLSPIMNNVENDILPVHLAEATEGDLEMTQTGKPDD